MFRVLKIIGIIILILAIIGGVVSWLGYRRIEKNIGSEAIGDMTSMARETNKLSPEEREQVRVCAERIKKSPPPELEEEARQIERQCASTTSSQEAAQQCVTQAAVKLGMKMARNCIARYQK